MNFYTQHLDAYPEFKQEMIKIENYINKHQQADFVNQSFQTILKEIDSLPKDRLTEYQRTQFRSTFAHLQLLYQKKDEFLLIKDEDARNHMMNSLTGGIEAGFASGKDPQTVNKALMEKINILILTYQLLQENNQLDQLITAVSQGDGCLTARTARIIELYTKLKIGTIEEEISLQKIAQTPTYMLSEYLSVWIEDSGLDKVDEDSRVNAIKELKMTALFERGELTKLKEQFEMFAKGETSLLFRSYLFDKGILKQLEVVEWSEEMLIAFLNLPEAKTWFEEGKNQALKNF